MESSRKRKAAAVANSPSTADGSASKRLRLLNSHAVPKNSVQEVGYKIVEQLRSQTDKTGRIVSTEFLELPDEEEIPEYYQIIRLPIALETIENKVKRDEYPDVSHIEGDLRRMVQNAKDFNDPGSVIYEDAERIRKLVYNFMKQHNPAYNDPGYAGRPTPIPKSDAVPTKNGTKKEQSEEVEAASRQISVKPSRAGTEHSDRKPSLAPSATAGGEEDQGEDGAVDLDLTGKTFQQAQRMILDHLLTYTDEEGLEIYSPFGNLPSRKLEDYYKIIRHPVCIKSVLKRARGVHGRAPPTDITDFKTWDAYGDEVSFIWRNAKEYNEDGSDMFKLAEDFEKHFRDLLVEAKEKVDEPSGPRIKIGAPKPKVTLNLSQPQRGSPAPGVAVDNEALARQKQLVQAAANGQTNKPTMNGFPLRPGSSDAIRPTSSNRSGSPFGAAIKTEHGGTASPAPAHHFPTMQPQPLTNGMMPPPHMRPMSGSPYPGQPPVTSYHYTAPALLPPTQLRPYPLEAALLPTVTVNSHPNLKVTHPFHLSIPPHATLSQQSSTFTLPNSHYFLQISATISKQLSMGRPYKLFVSVNGTRLTQRDTQFHSDSSRRTHVYEGSLAQGVNRIEVEVAAAKVDDEKGLDVEKVTLFANLMR